MSRRRGGGEGSIRERRPGLWEARVTVGFDAHGRQLRRSIYGKTRADVAARMTASLAKLADGEVRSAVTRCYAPTSARCTKALS